MTSSHRPGEGPEEEGSEGEGSEEEALLREDPIVEQWQGVQVELVR